MCHSPASQVALSRVEQDVRDIRRQPPGTGCDAPSGRRAEVDSGMRISSATQEPIGTVRHTCHEAWPYPQTTCPRNHLPAGRVRCSRQGQSYQAWAGHSAASMHLFDTTDTHTHAAARHCCVSLLLCTHRGSLRTWRGVPADLVVSRGYERGAVTCHRTRLPKAKPGVTDAS